MAFARWTLPLVICFFTFLECIGVLTGAIAKEILPALQNRATSNGGYAIAEQQCPAGTISCHPNYCCPSGTACREYAFIGYCCPTQNDCLPTLRSFPACADPSWVLYKGKVANNYFCCQTGQQGIYPGPGEAQVGLCVAGDMSVAVTQSASLYTPVSGASLSTIGSVSFTSTPLSPTLSSTSTSAVTTGTTQTSGSPTGTTQGMSTVTGASTSAILKPSSSVGSTYFRARVALMKAVGIVGVNLYFWL